MKILIWPSAVLKQSSEPVMEPLNMDYVKLMYNSMVDAGGVGLAAVQVGLLKRFFISNVNGVGKVYVNPYILTYLGKPEFVKEGCLSVPSQFEFVKRYPEVEVAYTTPDLSETKQEILYGLEAHVFQHEYEHLNGMLFIDKLPSAKRSNIIGNLTKLKKQGKL